MKAAKARIRSQKRASCCVTNQPFGSGQAHAGAPAATLFTAPAAEIHEAGYHQRDADFSDTLHFLWIGLARGISFLWDHVGDERPECTSRLPMHLKSRKVGYRFWMREKSSNQKTL
ncbi:hypothetical protein [Rhizobium sp. BT03]|uniref:hypothetical protein n=1 Tax=Rhizobium sp. BT03 TaxID=3045156 RepID=UPI0024B3CE77|nr:hypothetical protein [Rhizobium sp. BT03]WHO77344.1 hypothetical protein QMO80_006569 [Rhizobium sp. BT03]